MVRADGWMSWMVVIGGVGFGAAAFESLTELNREGRVGLGGIWQAARVATEATRDRDFGDGDVDSMLRPELRSAAPTRRPPCARQGARYAGQGQSGGHPAVFPHSVSAPSHGLLPAPHAPPRVPGSPQQPTACPQESPTRYDRRRIGNIPLCHNYPSVASSLEWVAWPPGFSEPALPCPGRATAIQARAVFSATAFPE